MKKIGLLFLLILSTSVYAKKTRLPAIDGRIYHFSEFNKLPANSKLSVRLSCRSYGLFNSHGCGETRLSAQIGENGRFSLPASNIKTKPRLLRVSVKYRLNVNIVNGEETSYLYSVSFDNVKDLKAAYKKIVMISMIEKKNLSLEIQSLAPCRAGSLSFRVSTLPDGRGGVDYLSKDITGIIGHSGEGSVKMESTIGSLHGDEFYFIFLGIKVSSLDPVTLNIQATQYSSVTLFSDKIYGKNIEDALEQLRSLNVVITPSCD